MDGLIMAAQMILGLSILVGLHEFGHLIAAKMFGMRVEQYSIGFPPRIFKFKFGETIYSIGAIPLGGYVKISGMIDESLDTETMKEEPKPWEFRAKPAWQRLIVMIGGIAVNVLTGIVIFVIMVYSNGETYIPKEEVNKYGIVANELGQKIGLKTGDKILKVNGHDYDRFSDLTSPDVLLEDNAYYTVKRGSDTLRVDIPGNFIEQISDFNEREGIDFITPVSRYTIVGVQEGTPAEEAGLQEGDRITKVNGVNTEFFHELQNLLAANAGERVQLTVEGKEQVRNVEATVRQDSMLGFMVERNFDHLNLATINYSLAQAIPKGTERAFNIVFLNIKAFGKIFSGELNFSKSVSGPIGIAREFGGQWDWFRFWTLVGLLSMILAFMNFLPIPALDGGHVMFLTFEIVSGHKPSDKFMENAQKVGMVILLSLMVFIIFNDIFKAIV